MYRQACAESVPAARQHGLSAWRHLIPVLSSDNAGQAKTIRVRFDGKRGCRFPTLQRRQNCVRVCGLVVHFGSSNLNSYHRMIK